MNGNMTEKSITHDLEVMHTGRNLICGEDWYFRTNQFYVIGEAIFRILLRVTIANPIQTSIALRSLRNIYRMSINKIFTNMIFHCRGHPDEF